MTGHNEPCTGPELVVDAAWPLIEPEAVLTKRSPGTRETAPLNVDPQVDLLDGLNTEGVDLAWVYPARTVLVACSGGTQPPSSSLANLWVSEVCRRPELAGRVAGWGVVGSLDPQLALAEAHYALDELGLHGLLFPAHVSASVRYASPEFAVVWRYLERRSAPVPVLFEGLNVSTMPALTSVPWSGWAARRVGFTATLLAFLAARPLGHQVPVVFNSGVRWVEGLRSECGPLSRHIDTSTYYFISAPGEIVRSDSPLAHRTLFSVHSGSSLSAFPHAVRLARAGWGAGWAAHLTKVWREIGGTHERLRAD